MTYAMLYLEINLFSIALLLFIRIKTKGITRMFSQQNFSMAVDSEGLLILSDTLCVMITSGVIPGSAAAIILLKTVYFFSNALMCYFWFVYFELLRNSSLVRTRKRIYASVFFVALSAVLLFINLFTGILFYVDAEGNYQRGPLFLLTYLLSYPYVLIASLRALAALFRKNSPAQRKLLTALALFPVAPAVAGIIQFSHPELPLVCAVLSFSSLCMYQMWIDRQITLDPLTQLNNRKQLLHFYEHWQSSPENGASLCLMMIDVNRFKSINDTYGHIEGDKALVHVADALRKACDSSGCLIARYGGDEFVVFSHADGAEKISGDIRAHLRAVSGTLPYALSVCIGTAKADRSKPLQDLIAEADEKLY